MKKNIGKFDKIARIVLAIIFGALYFTGTVSGTLGIVLLAAGIIFLATSFMGTCPLYLPFGINTGATETTGKHIQK